jgi:hypothetical protein
MTLRRTGRRLAILGVALIATVPALAQSSGHQAPPQTSPSSQAVPSPRAAAPQATPAQATPSQAAVQPTPAAPPGPAYDIEIVIFRTRAALGQSENWAAETTASSATVAGGESASSSGPAGRLLTVLPASDYRLAAIEARLRTSGTYQPVAHAAWVQTATAWGAPAGFPLESLGIDVPGLTGVVSLQRGEFLHLGMTLNYTMQDPPAGLNAPPGTTFVMNETRRVRFYQRNYYDHPAFGVIALITPARGPRPPGR